MKQSNKFIAGVLLGAMLFTNVSAVFAANSYTPQYNQGFNTGALQGKVVLVPTGTMIPAVASSNISSDTMDVGDSVSLALASPFSYNGTVLAPAGSRIVPVRKFQKIEGSYCRRNVFFERIQQSGKKGDRETCFTKKGEKIFLEAGKNTQSLIRGAL